MARTVRWPPDMVISVDPRSRLLHLLFDYSALRLENTRGIPSLVSEPRPLPSPSASPFAQSRWERDWDAVRQWYRTPGGDSASGSSASAVAGGAVRRSSGDDEARSRWFQEVAPRDLAPGQDSPEWVCLDALVPAWREGLDTILILPYRGRYAERLSTRVLLVSPSTRSSPSAYRAALSSPPTPGSPVPAGAP